MIEYSIAENKHLPMILELYKQLLPEENPIDNILANKIWKEIENNKIKYFIAMDGNKIISSCYLAIIPNLTRNGKSNGFIENVITDEKYRKKGIGKKVIEMAIEYGRQNNCYKIILQSNYKRKENHIFYEKCGFDGDSKRAFEIRFK
ncbi:MAG: GNAT family N-acetyltransferase [Treponema sp.]|jgi:GNAT superfamily N-acetyltransferase|nr:GNAT family N-acetyltransferase [Treponema sp.]